MFDVSYAMGPAGYKLPVTSQGHVTVNPSWVLLITVYNPKLFLALLYREFIDLHESISAR